MPLKKRKKLVKKDTGQSAEKTLEEVAAAQVTPRGKKAPDKKG